MLNNTTFYKRTRKDHVLNNEPIKLKKEYCENCFVQFSLMTLKFSHNCKRCFRTVCDSCGQQREKIIGCLEKPDQVHRICNMCKEERISVNYFIKKNHLKWGQSSSISDRWLESLGLFPQKKELNAEYQGLSEQIKTSWSEFQDKTPELEQVKKDLKEFHAAAIKYNYSFCEILHQLQGDTSNDIIQQQLYNIMVRFLFKYPDVGYTKEYLKILTFLMCFCTQQEAFFIFSNIIYYVIPPPLYPKEAKKNKMETVEKYLKYIIDDIFDQKGFGEENILLIKQFLAGSYFLYYQSFFINYLQFNVCFSIIDNIIMKRDFKEIEKYIKAICFMHLRNMRQVGSNTDQLNEVILRWTTKITDLDQIIAKNFKNIPHQYHLDLLDKTEQHPQPQKQSVDQSKLIENLKNDLETMKDYSKAIHDELQKKNLDIEAIQDQQMGAKKENENLKKEIENLRKEPKKTLQDEQQLLQLKSQYEKKIKDLENDNKKLKELENDNKNLKVEVFNNNMTSMKMTKKYEEDIAALNQKLQAAVESLRQEQMKVKKLMADIDQMKKTHSENERKLVEMLNQERTKFNQLQQQCKLMQSRIQQQQSNQSSPQTAAQSTLTSQNGSEIRQTSSQTLQLPKPNLQIQTSPGNQANLKLPPSPNGSKIPSMTSIPASPNNSISSPTRCSSSQKVDPVVLQLSQCQTQIQQQHQQMLAMRQRGEQLTQQLNQLQREYQQKDIQLKDTISKLETNHKKTDELHEEIEAKEMSITLLEKNQKINMERFQKDAAEKNQKIQELSMKYQKAQEQVEKMITEANASEKNSEQLFELQLGQKQASIEQKAHIIKEKDDELQQTKQKYFDIQKQMRIAERSLQNLESEKQELKDGIQAKEEELQQKNRQIESLSVSIGSQNSFNIKEKALLEREKELSQKLQTIENEKNSLNILSEQLNEKEQKLKQVENEIKEQQLQVIEQQEEVQESRIKLKQVECDLKKKSHDNHQQTSDVQQHQVQLQEKENDINSRESQILKQQESINEQQQSITQLQNQITIQQATLAKDKEDFKTKEQNFSQKSKFLQELQMQINQQQQELAKQKEILQEERRAIQRKQGDLDTIEKNVAEEETQKRQRQIKEMNEFMTKIETKLNQVHNKMKEDSNILCDSLGLNINLLEDTYFKEQEVVQVN